ncbi:tyrosine-type recombinase/integrase [Inediibacterium massiliense]|uniref:tyrosine-type recombinase/integrase n=1 Tax=Inediibacterium massiliense TaxID=1658111 RepID=UPI0006B675CE|nr:tyrosine-type recombinase/integrase [Inediibacterium massiliense]
MDTFNLQEVAEQSLRLLKQGDASAKTVKEYRTTGFGAVIRHFTRQGVLNVSAKMLDAFVLEQRELFERREFSEWKWRLVRRGSELLKHFAQTGTVELTELRPWEPVLRKPRQSVELDMPTPEQLADPDDLFALIWRVKQELLKAGLTKRTVRHYTAEGMTVILRRHTEQGLVHYSESLVSDMVAEIRSKYEQGLTSRVSYQNLRKASFLLAEMHRTGDITLYKVPDWGQREPAPEFAALLLHFCDNANRTGILAGSTVKVARSAIRTFFFELEARGRKSFDGITLAEVSDTITRMADRYTGGLHSAIFSVRVFLLHLYENNFTPENLSLAVPEMVACRTVFREGFTGGETARLLDEPNLETAFGKRDYAMMLLAAQTGLRACDVVNLKRENIDWRAGEIRIVQQKTGKQLSLPLEPESGNAIADYLLHARPESDLPYIFLCHTGALRPINNRSASALVTKYLRRANIVSHIPRRGFHSFQRSFGTRLLQNEIPLELLRQLLGHSKIDSAKPYLSVDEQGLKTCALGLVPCGKAGDLV